MEFRMYRELGDDGLARHCIVQLKQLRAKLASINTVANASSPLTGVTNASSLTGDAPPVEEVDLTGGEQLDITKDQTNEEVDLTNLNVDDNEAEQDVEEMCANDINAAQV
jgi:hypothetical protein